jgi:hypothetical protein
METSLSIDQEIPNSILDSDLGVISGKELFRGIYGMGVSVLVVLPADETPYTQITRDQGSPYNCIRAPTCAL